MTRLLFWDVDTQYDFLQPDGKLYVPRAEAIIPRLKALTVFAHAKGIRIIASAEDHVPGHPELKVNYSSGYSRELHDTKFHFREGIWFLPKPYDANTLLDTVARCLRGEPVAN